MISELTISPSLPPPPAPVQMPPPPPPVRLVRPGEPWFTKAGVEHWHGASPSEDMLQLTIYEGTVNWLGPVSDKEYLAAPATR